MIEQGHLYHRRCLTAALLLALVGACPTTSAGEFKGWQDQNGETHFGDAIPPEDRDRGAIVYSPRGTPTGVIAPARTAQQRKDDEAHARAIEAENRAKQARQAADRALLLTYPTLADLLAARDRDLATSDLSIRTRHATLRTQEQSLGQLRTAAADLERAGQPSPQHLRDSIGRAEHAISEQRKSIQAALTKKEEIRQSFDVKIEHYLQITQSAGAPPAPTAPAPPAPRN